ncbi:MAG: DUF6320 domain-containing protein [Clostridia bacterium]
MKYCTVCKVNVNKEEENCPLCGSFLEEKGDKPFEKYEEIEKYEIYPKVVLEEKVDFFRSRANRLLILIMVVAVAIDLFIAHTITWSAYAMCGTLFSLFCVLFPITRKSKLYNQIMIDLIIGTFLAVMLELIINKFTGIRISIKWVLPSIYLASIILCDIMIIIENHNKSYYGYFSALLFCTVFLVIFQVLVWAIPSFRTHGSLYSSIIFFASLLNIGVMAICYYKQVKSEYIRKWNI